MIHVDVKRHDKYPAYLVETSTNGAGWKTQYIVNADVIDKQLGSPEYNHELVIAKKQAEHIARHMGTAWTYAGIQWRGTSGGYNL